MCLLDMHDANQTDLKHRFLRGGLPPFFLPEKHPEGDNIVLAHDVERAFTRNYGDLRVRFDGIRSFADSISS